MFRVLVFSLLCLLSWLCTANGLEYFYCPTDQRPIPKDYVCDGYNDCPSGADESDCGSGLMCGSHEMMCSVDNKCINLAFQCDGISHCSDGSDEQDCNKRCDYQCSNTGKCISAVLKCDGRNDCGDNSDEASCGGSCDSETEWHCPSSGQCLSRNWLCDREIDCSGGADEANCETYSNPCGIGMFNCSSSWCIDGNKLCDGFEDCTDGSDEDETICYVLNCKGKFTCPEQCLEYTHVCDGVYDCIDNRDEMNCDSRCGPDEFMCISGSCIRLNETCNGNVDCADGSDEFLCPNTKKERVTCDTNEFPCLDGLQCIPDFSLCDDIEQCADGSDENECPAVSTNINECNSTDNGGYGGCDHYCHDTVHYRYCSCRDGYTLNSTDMSTCYDINECQENPHICTHYCTNTLGSFYCSCDVGYTHSEVYGCTANGPPPYLLFTNWFDIQKVNDTVSGSYSDILLEELRNAASLDYHYKYEYVYWTDIVRKVIMRAHLNGSDIREIVNYGISRPESLAIDWIHGLVYWTDSVLKRIEVSNLNGEKRAIIFSGLHSPRDIVIDPLNRLMFWIDRQQIFKASLDGTDKTLFLSATDHVYWPVKLTIDYPTGTLYWVDVASKTIGKCHTDGSGMDTLYNTNISNPSGLTVFENKVFWTERSEGVIYSANKGTGKQFETVLQSIYMPTDLALVHPLRQPRGVQDDSLNQCNVKRCQHLCIVGRTNETASCYCPPSSSVEDDGVSCSRSQLFILFSVNEELHTVSLETEDRYDLQIPIYYNDDDGDGGDSSKSNIISTDWDNNTVYYADSSLGTINSLSLSGGTPTVLVDQDVSLPVGIAIDWSSKKLYWTDSILSHIYMSELDGSLKTAVIVLDEGTLTDIVVHPLKGYLIYGVKNGKHLLIKRANLDGSDDTELYKSQTTADQIYGSPESLTVDDNRVYWVDSKNLRLESILINGSDHEILYDNFGLLSSISGLDQYGDKLYWTEKIGDAIRWVEKEPPYTHGVFLANKEQLRSISIYHTNRRIPDTHPCLIANGGCSHMCVGISASGEDLIASCLCPTGYLLQQDKKNCAESIDNYIVIASEGSLGRISLDTQSGVYVTTPTSSYQPINPHSIAVDIQTNDTYWVDGSNIYKNSGGAIKVIISSISERPTALAIDWIGRMLYWAEGNTRRIEVSTLDGLQRKVLLSGSIVSEVSSIVLDMKHQYMFWAMPMASLENVYRANMDGTAPTPIIRSTDVTQPSSIAIDDDSKLYVADVIADKIYSFNLDGSHKRELGRTTDPKSIVVDDDYLYWMNRDSGVLHRVDKHVTVNNFVSAKVARNIDGFNSMSIKRKSAYDRRGAYEHHCAVKKCENICLPNSGGYQCTCPTGIKPVGSYCPNVPSVYLLLSTTSTMRRISLDTNDFMDVSLMENKTHRIHDIAHYNGRIYWSESTNGVVYMSDANGTNVRIYNRRGDGGDISLDKSTGNMYYINNNNIEVTNGKHHKMVVSSEGNYVISSITVDSMRRKLYWIASDDAGPNYIMQSDVNGSNISTLFSNDSYHPVKLHLSNRHLYWIDTDTIQMLSLIEPDIHPATVLKHGSTDITVHNNLLFTINDGQVLQTDVKTGRIITVYTNKGSGNAVNLHIVNSSYVQSHSSCTGNDCDHMCLSLSSRYYQCVCPDSLNDTACTEEIHFIPDATSSSAVPSSTINSIIPSSSPVSSATPTYQGPTISLSGDTSGGFTTGELVILLLIILLFIAVVITIVVIIVLYCKYKRMSEANGVSTKIVKNPLGSNKLNNIPSSLPPLSNLPTRQLNNVSELDQKKKGDKNCNIQQKGTENEDFPIKKPAKPAQPLPSQSFTPQSRSAAPLQATHPIQAKPQSTSSQTIPAAQSAPTRPATAKPAKPRPPPLPPITKTPIKAKRCVRVKFDVEDDDDAPPPIPPRSTTCTPTSPPYATPSAPLVTPVTSFPVPISPPPVVTTPPLSPGHLPVSAHNPLYDDSMDN